MEESAEDCFESLWANTATTALAGQQLTIPSMELGILFLVLHSLRSPALPACREELEYLASLTRQEALSEQLLELAEATGAMAAVRPFLEDLLAENVAPVWPEPSAEWRSRIVAQEPGSTRLLAIFRAPWIDKPRMLWRAFFPRPEVFLSGNIYADMSFPGRLRQHRARWTRFLQGLPNLLRDLRKL
jgi:hypothetical protein